MQQEPTNGTAPGAVYVQTNAAPNEVVAFRRGGDGSLEPIGSMATGGDGDGSPHLQSQGSVVLTGDGMGSPPVGSLEPVGGEGADGDGD